MSRVLPRALVLSLALAACGGTTAAPDGSTTGVDGGTPGTDAGPPDAGPQLITLISGDWTLAPHTEAYECVRLTLDHDVFVHRFHPVIPLGTHHTVLTVGVGFDGPQPDGTTPCSGLFANGPNMLFGSGVGTGDLELPPGIAVKVPAGTQMTLNLHLFNIGADTPLSGTSAIQVETMEPSAITDLAEIFLAGADMSLTVPAHMTSTQHGTCSNVAPGHVFAVFPHMHQTGIHQKVTLRHASGATEVMLDTDYSFDMQQYHALTPTVDTITGDAIDVDCTYDNPGAQKVFGEHTTDEMCFAGIYRWPAAGTLFYCVS